MPIGSRSFPKNTSPRRKKRTCSNPLKISAFNGRRSSFRPSSSKKNCPSPRQLEHHLQRPQRNLLHSQRPRRSPPRSRRALLHSRHQGRARICALLKGAIDEYSADLRIVMRVYFEKPRTTIGWKGLINDPYLDQSYKINDGLRLARHLLLDLAEMGVPTGTEFLDMISPQYIAGLVSWGAIGARTSESQVHRQLVPAFVPRRIQERDFRRRAGGHRRCAVRPYSHTFLGHTHHGQSAIFVTTGNPECHIILRGGRKTVNYTAECVAETAAQLEKAGVAPAHHDRLQPRQ